MRTPLLRMLRVGWPALCVRMPAACGEDLAGPPPPTDDDWATLLENRAPYLR